MSPATQNVQFLIGLCSCWQLFGGEEREKESAGDSTGDGEEGEKESAGNGEGGRGRGRGKFIVIVLPTFVGLKATYNVLN